MVVLPGGGGTDWEQEAPGFAAQPAPSAEQRGGETPSKGSTGVVSRGAGDARGRTHDLLGLWACR